MWGFTVWGFRVWDCTLAVLERGLVGLPGLGFSGLDLGV